MKGWVLSQSLWVINQFSVDDVSLLLWCTASRFWIGAVWRWFRTASVDSQLNITKNCVWSVWGCSGSGCYRMDLDILRNIKLWLCVFSQDCPSKQDLQNSIQQAHKLLSAQEASYLQSLRTLRKKLNLLHDSVARRPAKAQNCRYHMRLTPVLILQT